MHERGIKEVCRSGQIPNASSSTHKIHDAMHFSAKTTSLERL